MPLSLRSYPILSNVHIWGGSRGPEIGIAESSPLHITCKLSDRDCRRDSNKFLSASAMLRNALVQVSRPCLSHLVRNSQRYATTLANRVWLNNFTWYSPYLTRWLYYSQLPSMAEFIPFVNVCLSFCRVTLLSIRLPSSQEMELVQKSQTL